jgi:hypothetical protein
MKFITLSLCIFTLCISCSTTPEAGEAVADTAIFQRGTGEVPENSSNPYDNIGQTHNEVLQSYYDTDTVPSADSACIERLIAVAKSNPYFVQLGIQPYELKTIDRINYINDNIATCRPAILSAAISDAEARTDMTNFLSSLFSLCDNEEDYQPIYEFIVTYENAVLNSKFDVNDKKHILMATSIARHSAYARKKKPKKNKDPEWALMVGNIFAGLDGADESDQETVIRALAVGILQNKE